jgi:hypothetical protein
MSQVFSSIIFASQAYDHNSAPLKYTIVYDFP